MKIISDCPLCSEHSLHVIGDDTEAIMQCLHCGYVSSSKYIGDKDTNEEYKKLPDQMKKWTKSNKNRMWIPTMLTLPDGMLYPMDDKDGKMKWGLSPMVDIPKEEQKDYPDGNGGFYQKRYDPEKQVIYDSFFDAMIEINKKSSSGSPKLSKG